MNLIQDLRDSGGHIGIFAPKLGGKTCFLQSQFKSANVNPDLVYGLQDHSSSAEQLCARIADDRKSGKLDPNDLCF